MVNAKAKWVDNNTTHRLSEFIFYIRNSGLVLRLKFGLNISNSIYNNIH